MSEAEGAELADVQIVVADWYRKRLGSFFRRTLNQGLGAYLVFAIALTACLIAGRLAWIGGLEDRAYVSALMKAEIQPQSEATRSVVLSLLLAGLEASPLADELYCNGTSRGACGLGFKLWKTTQGLVNAADAPLVNEAARADQAFMTLGDFVEHSRLESFNREIQQNAEERSRIHDEALLSGVDQRDDFGDPCGDPRTMALRSQSFYLAPPSCVGSASTPTIQVIPQQSADALDVEQAKPADNAALGKTQALRLRDFRVLRARLDAQLFDIAVRSMQKELMSSPAAGAISFTHEKTKPHAEDDENAAATGPTIAAAFFISVDSVIRYWTRAGTVAPSDLPAHRLWAARPYFEVMLEHMDASKPLITRAYMDFAGHGIVYTECHAVTADEQTFPDRTAAQPAADVELTALTTLQKKVGRIIVGAVCTDYALSDWGVRNLVAKINTGPVADAGLVVFSTGPAGKWAPEPDTLHDWARTKHLENALRKAADSFSADAASRRDIQPLDVKGQDSSVFLVPLRVRGDGKLDAIVLRVGGVGPLGSRPEAMILTTVCGAIALGALLAGFRSSKAVATREQLLGRLRSLQVAVIQTDGSDRITAANDRAEELVAYPLPPFGSPESLRANFPEFWAIFDRRSILLEPSGPLRPFHGGPLPKLQSGSEEDIKKERRLGNTTAYFVRLRSPRTACGKHSNLSPWWLRISAGPILSPMISHLSMFRSRSSAEAEFHATFGVVEPVLDSVGDELEKEFHRKKPKENDHA